MNLSKPVPSTLNPNNRGPMTAAYKTIPINPRMLRAEDVRLCKNCKHFQAIDYYANKEDGYCKLFGKMNVINGDMAYAFASEARDTPIGIDLTITSTNNNRELDETDPMCGLEALFYEEAETETETETEPHMKTDIKKSG